MTATTGTPADLVKYLRQTRNAGEGRSTLAGPFLLDQVEVTPHLREDPPEASFIKEQEAVEDDWPYVIIRYSRLVEPIAPPGLGEFLDRLRALAGHPEFVRLNRTKQLGTTSLAGNIGASHCRLEHTLGVLDLALHFCEKLDNFFDAKPGQWGDRRDGLIRSILVYAFVHDAFHGPYGHTLDPVRFLIDPKCRAETDRLDKASLNAELKRARRKEGWLWLALLEVYKLYKDQQVETLQADVDTLYAMVVERSDALSYAREIVDAAVDADRLDYIPRDHVHLFLSSGINVQDLVGTARFFPAEDGKPELHFAEQKDRKLLNLLQRRIYLYDNVYEARAKVPYDEMIIHAVLLLLDDFRCGVQALLGDPEFDSREAIAREFARLSDVDLHRLFDLLPPTPRVVLGRLLLEDVRANAPYVVLAQSEIPPEGMAAMRIRLNCHREQLFKVLQGLSAAELEALQDTSEEMDETTLALKNKALRKIVAVTEHTVPYTAEDDLEFEVLKRFAEQYEEEPGGRGGRLALGKVEKENIYWMCLFLSDNIYMRRTFEWRLWRRFQKTWVGYGEWRGQLVGELTAHILQRDPDRWESEDGERRQTPLGALRAGVRQLIDENPLVFVNATKIPPTIRDIALRHRVAEAPIRLYNDRGEKKFAAKLAGRYGPPSYYVRLVIPASLDQAAQVLLQSIWSEEVSNWGWLEPGLMAK